MAVSDTRFHEFLEELSRRDSGRAEAIYDGVTYSLVLLGLRLHEIEELPLRHVWRYLEISKRLQESLGFWQPPEPPWDVSIINPSPRGSRP
jgi:hypothetical protein